MRSQTRRIRRPLTDEELEAVSARTGKLGGEELNNVVHEFSLEKISLKERRKEAEKPLYISRV